MAVTATVYPATPERWDDVAAAMGTRGDPAHCWCQFFRLRGRDWRDATREDNREALRAQVHDDDAPPGVLAYADGRPVGWCAVAPKTSYPKLLASRISPPETDGVWAVTCFVVVVGWRRRGVAAGLLDGAVGFAQSHGARVLEAYPVDPAARTSVSAAELYHGTVSLFADAGFEEIARPSAGRAVMRLGL